jgi:hypothetical protein
MDNGGLTAAQIIIVALLAAGPLIVFIILYALDFSYLSKRGYIRKTSSRGAK